MKNIRKNLKVLVIFALVFLFLGGLCVNGTKAKAAVATTTASLNTETRGRTIENDAVYYTITTTGDDSFYEVSFSNINASGMRFNLYSDVDMTDASRLVNEYEYAAGTSNENLGKLEKNHTYYLKVTGSVGDFKFTITEKKDDNGDTINDSKAIATNSECTGYALQNDKDVDYFKITTSANDSFYEVSFSNINGYYIYFDLYSDVDMTNASRLVDKDTYKANTSYQNLGKLEKNHTYYLKVTGYVGDYKFTMTEKKDDNGDTINDSKAVAINSECTGYSLQNDKDVDYYKITTSGNDSFYGLSYSNINGYRINFNLYSDVDMTNASKLVDDDIYEVGTGNVNLGKLARNHTYYIKIDGNVGDYKFTMTEKKDDISDTVVGKKSLSFNKTYKYTMQNTVDTDFFSFKTNAYDTYKLDFANINMNGSSYITIYSGKDCTSDQVVLNYYIYKATAVAADRAVLKLKTNHTYYVKIESDNTGDYRIGIHVSAPANAAVKNVQTKRQVKISWSKLSKATGYQVYRSTKKNGTYKPIKKVTKNTTTSFVDKKGIKSGTTYYYKVRAYKKVGSKTYYSQYSSVKKIKAK